MSERAPGGAGVLGRDDVDRNEDIEEGGAGTLLVGSNGEEMDGVVYYIKNGGCVRSAREVLLQAQQLTRQHPRTLWGGLVAGFASLMFVIGFLI